MVRSSKTGRWLAATAAAVAIAAGNMTAMSGSASAGVPAADPPGVVASEKVLKYLSTVPTKIPITVPLTKRPPKGLSVFFIGPNQPQTALQYDGFAAGATALGWIPTRMGYPSNPADAVGLVQQAIQQGAKLIAVTGTEVAVLQPALDAARAANVPVFLGSTAAVPAGRANWVFASVGSLREWVVRGDIAAAQVVAAANGKANTLVYNVPQYAVFSAWVDAFRTKYKQLCPTCVLNGEVNVPIGDVFSGKASSAVIAYLRAHPEVNQIACSNGAWCLDFASKAAAAGINISSTGIGLNISSVTADNLPQIVAKTVETGLASPNQYLGWQLVDAMARQSIGNSLIPNWRSRAPLFLWTQQNTTSTSQMYAGPINYTGQFKKLWKVS